MLRYLLLAATLLTPAILAAADAPNKPRYGTWGVAVEDMDKTVKPGDGFFDYAEGTWLKNYAIPADKVGAGYNYQLPDEIELQVRGIVEEVAKQPTTQIARQVGDFYAAWMDESGIETRGLAPLKPWLSRIDAVQTRGQLVQLMMQPGYAAPVNIGISADQDDPTRYTATAGQARLGLPTRDYYLLKGEKYDAIRKAYRDYVIHLQTLAGLPDAAARADRIIALETRLSEDQWTPEARRDPVKTHNPMTRAKLDALAPEFDWTATLAAMGLGQAKTVDVAETTAVTAAGKRLADVPIATWKEYLIFRFISDHANYLPRAFDAARFGFYSHTLNDVPEQRARWKRGMQMIDNSLGEAVGQIYVDRYWPASTAKLADELVADMRAAYADKIAGASWMDGATRKAALAKLATFDPRVGHPANWIDYSTLKVSRTDPLANDMATDDFQWRLQLARFSKPVDRSLWFMTPQTVNAYYDPTMNQITLPAAILQPPFFDAAADPAVNYAETGATTIGHEMGHGFDDQGRQYDEKGRLRDWWSKETAAKYTVKADRLAAQFDRYEPIPGVHIKGKLTLGENLADLGGLETAYAAYRRYVSRHGEPAVIDGYTGDQRFFIAYAQAWQGKRRDGAVRQQLLSDPHSPDKYRVDGIVRNFDPWYAAFDVKPGDKLYLPPEERVHIWTQ
ncbi:M13 family metallopeptidase [Sphingomonas sp. So64.6b]|uniref:M13 family metallopeptidase n=1 Tax=Sphingomonas sp. So64.6b TaxID=2997354 RepID=UPI0016043D15|nr:M13 family metallopeptidase [Sphingomonas sp. So64.6b]QNA83323.1 M13 family metallopeptidase [Sphingomonas sp. So64.6b]